MSEETLQEQIDELRTRLDELVIQMTPGTYPVLVDGQEAMLTILPWEEDQ